MDEESGVPYGRAAEAAHSEAAHSEAAHSAEEAEDRSEEGEYYGEVYGGQGSRFDWFWFAVTWLTVPLFAAYLIYRIVT
jgi:hypothetical protein